MQGGKNWFLPKEMNANRFFCDSHWLEIWSNHFYPSMGPNGGSVAMDSVGFFISNLVDIEILELTDRFVMYCVLKAFHSIPV
jgi:hypothetical protein